MKKIGIFFGVLLFVIMTGVNGWYYYVYFFQPDLYVAKTYKVGMVELEDGTQKPFLEVNLYDDLFEIKFNYLLDENRENFMSQGIQYFAPSGQLDFSKYFTAEDVIEHGDLSNGVEYGRTDFWNRDYYVNAIGTGAHYTKIERINYMSSDDYENTMPSSNPISIDTFFKITLDGKIYGMKFKGVDGFNYTSEKSLYVNSVDACIIQKDFIRCFMDYFIYQAIDVDYFAELIYNSISGLDYGVSTYLTFEFGDLFNYYDYDEETGTYESQVSNENAKVKDEIKNYYSIKVNHYEGKVQRADQSLFNKINNSSNYNISGSEGDSSYFVGRTIINLDETDFLIVKTSDNTCKLQLNEDCKNYYFNYKALIELYITIDLNYFDELGISFDGFVVGTLDDFEIYKIETKQVVGDETVISEVAYE